MLSDFFKSRFRIRRVRDLPVPIGCALDRSIILTESQIWFLPIVALLFVASQVAALHTFDVAKLWIVSTLLGAAYGSLFNVMPMLVLEWFGMSESRS
jgi:hypothetical protein